MFEVNFNEVNEDGLRFFQSKYLDIFDEVFTVLKDHKVDIERMGHFKPLDESDAKPSLLRKAGMIAKKVAVNSLISGFTGIEPMMLDNDTSFLREPGDYMHCDLKRLIYMVVCVLNDGLSQFIEKLKTDDVAGLREILLVTQNFEKRNYGHIPRPEDVEGELSYELILGLLLLDAGIIDIDKMHMALAIHYRGYKLDVPIPFVDKIAAVYTEYLFDTRHSTRQSLAKKDINPEWVIEGSKWIKCPNCGEKRPFDFIRAVKKCPACGQNAFGE